MLARASESEARVGSGKNSQHSEESLIPTFRVWSLTEGVVVGDLLDGLSASEVLGAGGGVWVAEGDGVAAAPAWRES